MSKAGVAQTQGYRKTRERVEFEERIVDGRSVSGKKCSKCGVWKELENSFSKKKGGLGGRRAECTICEAERSHKYQEENKELRTAYFRKRYGENKERILENNRRWVRDNQKIRLEYLRNYRKENREKENERVRTWRKENPERHKAIQHRRRARKKALVDDFTHIQMREVLAYFSGGCALTGSENIHWDHVIPLVTGHAGTTLGNMIPLRHDLNESKGEQNIFEFFKMNRQRFELSYEKFNFLIKWLAAVNDKTIQEYRDYVYWCHENPRKLDDLEMESEVMS
ncbi:hypothetical protein [Bacillus sp. EE-W1]|uniref:hypothetical protein n=1 Tax=Bacillus sp. EE-W1 TaxID=2662453 RepID=UPI0012F8577C|nr:hypothetical protein [Bacillus sp. EE-W1]